MKVMFWLTHPPWLDILPRICGTANIRLHDPQNAFNSRHLEADASHRTHHPRVPALRVIGISKRVSGILVGSFGILIPMFLQECLLGYGQYQLG
jgi:hypothetical protein